MSKLVHTDCCPICGSNSLHKEFSAVDRLVSQETFDVWLCDHCGFRFTQDVPDEQEIASYYESSDYISHSDVENGLMNRLYHLARNMMLTAKAGHVTRATDLRQGWLLDIASSSWKIDPRDRMALLMACCKDCIGALSIVEIPEEDE